MQRITKKYHTHTLPFESIAMGRIDMRLILIAPFVIVDMAFYHLMDLRAQLFFLFSFPELKVSICSDGRSFDGQRNCLLVNELSGRIDGLAIFN